MLRGKHFILVACLGVGLFMTSTPSEAWPWSRRCEILMTKINLHTDAIRTALHDMKRNDMTWAEWILYEHRIRRALRADPGYQQIQEFRESIDLAITYSEEIVRSGRRIAPLGHVEALWMGTKRIVTFFRIPANVRAFLKDYEKIAYVRRVLDRLEYDLGRLPVEIIFPNVSSMAIDARIRATRENLPQTLIRLRHIAESLDHLGHVLDEIELAYVKKAMAEIR